MSTLHLDRLGNEPFAVKGLLVLLVAISLVSWLLRYNQRPKAFPPGPPTIPIIGNIHQMPAERPYLKFAEWSKKYGGIMGLKIGSQRMVVLTSTELIREAFVTRGAAYSGRPLPYLTRELIFPHQDHMFNLQNGEQLRRTRTALKRLTGPAGLRDAKPLQESYASRLVADIARGEETPERCLRLCTFSIGMEAMFGPVAGDRAPALLDEYTELQHALLGVSEGIISSLFDLLPLLKHLPFFPEKQRARQIGASLRAVSESLFDRLKSQLSQAQSHPVDIRYWGLIGSILQHQDAGAMGREKAGQGAGKQHLSDLHLTMLGQFVQDAATDTTLSTTMSCIMALTANQRLLQKVQEEVDAAYGSDGDISRTDLDKLPYVRACVFETLRWRPPAPILLPHRLERDDELRGFHLPQGTTVIANAWAVHHDPEVFEKPDVFDPDRYAGHLAFDASFPGLYPFGLGRRACPGDQLALSTVMILVAKLAHSFGFSFDGAEPDLSVEKGYSAGIILSPKTFPMRFTPR